MDDILQGEKYRLYHGDCLQVMKQFPDNSFDMILTDPPYGIGINKSNRLSVSRGFGSDKWDEQRLDEHIAYLRDKFSKKNIIIWGGNYYADILPPTRGWLIWDKLNDGRDFGEAELAWTNLDSVIRRYKKFPVSMDGGKVHPTQKPIELMIWCIEKVSNQNDLIIDPFMGSGTTGVACAQTGRRFIGIELDAEYFKIAERRIANAYAQPLLFDTIPETPKAEQRGLL